MICIVRHGQTDWNIAGKNQGHTDIELNQTGIAQARELARKLEEIRFDLVISSPLKRALKTAEIIRSGSILCDERIKERYNGELEGRTDAASLVDFSDPKDTRYGIEPLPLFRKRIREFWDEILQKYPEKNVLVVTHAGVVIYTQAYFKGEPADGNFLSYKIGNGEVLKFTNEGHAV